MDFRLGVFCWRSNPLVWTSLVGWLLSSCIRCGGFAKFQRVAC